MFQFSRGWHFVQRGFARNFAHFDDDDDDDDVFFDAAWRIEKVHAELLDLH